MACWNLDENHNCKKTGNRCHTNEYECSVAKDERRAAFAQSRSSGGCYVATCVYGSYDCPEVWTLRRYRDNNLKQSLLGRQFIRVYYAIGPKIVKSFGNKHWFHKLWKVQLDKFISRLQNNGVDSTPYCDR